MAATALKMVLEDASDSLIVANNPHVARFPGLAEHTAASLDEEVEGLPREWEAEREEGMNAPTSDDDPRNQLGEVSAIANHFGDETGESSAMAMESTMS